MQSEKLEKKQQLELVYLPLPELEALLLTKNPNKHDLGSIIFSITTYGFKQPVQLDVNLNKGTGGIVAGNGRVKSLALLYKENPEQRIGGIRIDEHGRWLVPTLVGVDSADEAQAMRYSIDDNNIGMLGGDFSALDIARNWDLRSYIDVLQEFGTTVSVDNDDLSLLMRMVELEDAEDLSGTGDTAAEDEPGDRESTLNVVKLFFTDEQKELFDGYVKTFGRSAEDLILEALGEMV